MLTETSVSKHIIIEIGGKKRGGGEDSGKGNEKLTASLLTLGSFTRVSGPTDGVPLAGRWSVTTKAFDICCWARNLRALCSAVSTSASSAFFIKDD